MGVLVDWHGVALECRPVVKPSQCDAWATSSPPSQIPAALMRLQPNVYPATPHVAVGQWV